MAEKNDLLEYIVNPLKVFGLHIVGACRDLLPIILVILVFQLAVVRQPFPDVLDILVGLVLVIIGVSAFCCRAGDRTFSHRGGHGGSLCPQGEPFLVAPVRIRTWFFNDNRGAGPNRGSQRGFCGGGQREAHLL